MLGVIERGDHVLLIETVNKWKEYAFAVTFSLLGIVLPILFPASQSTTELLLKFAFGLVFIWIGFLNLGYWDHISFNKNSNEVRISRTDVFQRRKVYVCDLDKLVSAEIRNENLPREIHDTQREEDRQSCDGDQGCSTSQAKRQTPKYRIILKFEEGIEMPLTETLYAAEKDLEVITAAIKEFSNL